MRPILVIEKTETVSVLAPCGDGKEPALGMVPERLELVPSPEKQAEIREVVREAGRKYHMATPPFGKKEEAELREKGPIADQILAGETPSTEKKPMEGESAEGATGGGMDPDVKIIMDGLKISEDSAKMVMGAAAKNPDLSAMEAKELVKYLKKNPTMLMRLMEAGSGMEPDAEEMTTLSYGPEV
jgi:hypothetical protein